MAPNLQHTLWLWTEGSYARRVMYTLMIKGLVHSASDLLRGKTTQPNLHINTVKFVDQTTGWELADPSDPPPVGATNPCMRITDATTGESVFIHESESIIRYLEDFYSEHPTQPSSAVERARMTDLISRLNGAIVESSYFIRNTVPEYGAVLGVTIGHRATALNAKHHATKGLLKVQEWAGQNGLGKNGWITPGVDGPGLVDVVLASHIRFNEVMFGFNLLDDAQLTRLAEWYERFKKLQWWKDFEERDDIIPSSLGFGRTSRAPWVEEQGF